MNNGEICVKNSQIGSVILYNIYIDLFKIEIFEATSSQIEYFDQLKNHGTTEKTIKSFLKIGKEILKIRKNILNIWEKLIEINPYNDEAEKTYMLYLRDIRQDDELANNESKKFKKLRNREKNEVYFKMFDSSLSCVLLIDGYTNNGKIIYFTPNFPSVFMFSNKEILSISIDDLLPSAVQKFHEDLVNYAIKYSNLEGAFSEPIDAILKGKESSLFSIKTFVKIVPNLTYGLVYIVYISRVNDAPFMILLDEKLKINGYTDEIKNNEQFTINKNFGLTPALINQFIAMIIPDILFNLRFSDNTFSVSKKNVDLKANLYPNLPSGEMNRKLHELLEIIRVNGSPTGSIQDPKAKEKDEKNDFASIYNELIKEITARNINFYSIYYRIEERIFIGGKYKYYKLFIMNDNRQLDLSVAHHSSEKESIKETNIKDGNLQSNITFDFDLKPQTQTKEIKLKAISEKKEDKDEEEDEEEKQEEKNNDKKMDFDDENIILNKKPEKNKGANKVPNLGGVADLSRFNKLKMYIIDNRQNKSSVIMKLLCVVFWLVNIVFLITDNDTNKKNIIKMDTYLRQNLFLNHTKFVCITIYDYFTKFYMMRSNLINESDCGSELCSQFYLGLLDFLNDDLKKQKDNITIFDLDYREKLSEKETLTFQRELNQPVLVNLDVENTLSIIQYYITN